jgi:hypothetical protein
MTAQRTDSPMRALGLAVALFAITLNFLQPVAHAAMMREGAPWALWTVFCNSTAADPAGKSDQMPIKADAHDCCLGLAHAPAIAAPPVFFVATPPVTTFVAPLVAAEQPTSVGIRDGPTRPRGPPSFA